MIILEKRSVEDWTLFFVVVFRRAAWGGLSSPAKVGGAINNKYRSSHFLIYVSWDFADADVCLCINDGNHIFLSIIYNIGIGNNEKKTIFYKKKWRNAFLLRKE